VSHDLNVTFLNLPYPRGFRVHRQYAGGFGTVEHLEPGGQTGSTLMPRIFSAQAAAIAEGMEHRTFVIDALCTTHVNPVELPVPRDANAQRDRIGHMRLQ